MASAPWLAAGQLQGRWTDAGELEIGDRIWQADGTTETVESVAAVAIQQRMYNLTVAEAHTFFVGQQGWLVHNCFNGVTRGSNIVRFKGHYVRHKGHLENITGKKYAKWKQSNQGQEFIEDINGLVESGRLAYDGLGTLKKGIGPGRIYRGEGVTLVLRENGEFWTLIKSGEGLDLGIQMLP